MVVRLCFGWGGAGVMYEESEDKVTDPAYKLTYKRSIRETGCIPANEYIDYCEAMKLKIKEYCVVWTLKISDTGGFSGGSIFVYEFEDEADAMAFKLRWL